MQTDETPPRPARDRYVAHAQALMRRRRATFAGLAQTMTTDWQRFDRQTVSAAVKGGQSGKPKLLPTKATVENLDAALRADGELLALWQDAVIEDTAIRIGRPTAGLLTVGQRTVVATRGVGATDRRQLFEGVGGLTAATVLATTSKVRDELDGARPKSFTVTELELQLADLQRDLWSVAPAVLFPPGFEAWQQVEDMLNRRVLLPAARRLTLLAGHFAAELSAVARFGGDDRLGRRFAEIAEEHAAAAADPLLIARVAGVQTWIAMEAGHWSFAADHAAQGRRSADRSQHARLAGYEAEAAAAAGDHVRAAEAIGVMRAGMGAALKGPVSGNLPGYSPPRWNGAEEDLYTALAAASTPGSGKIAIHHGTRAASEFVHDNQGVGLAHIAIARGHLDGDHPDPAAAAFAGIAALGAVVDSPNAVVEARARALHRDLDRWDIAEVDQFGARIAAI
ncbi:hypothetical protein [Frankia sp. KB5]|uniref:hypothetical protein n=1 Tax=Frankia sp. KB5 TaxID=683318 RepID=UPI000A21D3A3|nr:hypothetical protein [Frankia sp. KB5]ORT46891.1 hypothetical protein KBI5_22735 [Frankia sp. KB5]